MRLYGTCKLPSAWCSDYLITYFNKGYLTDAGISSPNPCSSRDSLSVAEFDLPDYVQRYCDDKKDRYMRQSTLPESDWPPSLGGSYISLALIKQERSVFVHRYESVIEQQIDYTRGDYDKIMKHKTKIELIDAFGRHFCEGGIEMQLKMLIDGAPGVGKTTLSRKVVFMWAKGEILQRFWLVLLLHLRESAVSKANNIDEFFYHDDADLQQRVVKFVRERCGEGVLIIFDGFDELSLYERSEESLFLDVTRGKILPKCAVVVTSRPYASRPVQSLSVVNRHVEVLGFTEAQVKRCIRTRITNQDKAEELCTELKDRLDIVSICQIPLNCSIMLYVYEQEGYSLPHTLTELYDLFILHSLKRFLSRSQNSVSADRLLNLSELHSPVREHFSSLCSLAFNGLVQDKLVFSRKDIEEIFPQESYVDPPVLDLMTSAKSYSSRGAHDTYSFLHLTIQEFLAAYWVAHYSPDANKLEFCQQNLMENRFRMVMLFLSGMTKLSFPGASSVFSMESWEKDKVHICHLTYEARNHSLCKYICEHYCESPKKIELTGSRFDVLVVSNFIMCSDCLLDEVKLRACDVKVVHKVFSQGSSTLIKNLVVSFESNNDNDFTPLSLVDKLPRVNRVTISIRLSGTNQDKKLDETLLKNLSLVFCGPQAIKNQHYCILLEESASGYHYPENCNVIVARFCRTLVECLVQNCYIAEVELNCVLPSDVTYIFASLSEEDSISNLECLRFMRVNCYEIGSKQEAYFKDFCDKFATFLSKNSSLKELHLDLSPYIEMSSGYIIETIMPGLVNNTTLQILKLHLSSYKVVLERNETTGKMELACAPKLFHTLSVIQTESNEKRLQNNTPVMSSCPPPAKRPCVQVSVVKGTNISPNVNPHCQDNRLCSESQFPSRHHSRELTHSQTGLTGPLHARHSPLLFVPHASSGTGTSQPHSNLDMPHHQYPECSTGEQRRQSVSAGCENFAVAPVFQPLQTSNSTLDLPHASIGMQQSSSLPKQFGLDHLNPLSYRSQPVDDDQIHMQQGNQRRRRSQSVDPSQGHSGITSPIQGATHNQYNLTRPSLVTQSTLCTPQSGGITASAHHSQSYSTSYHQNRPIQNMLPTNNIPLPGQSPPSLWQHNSFLPSYAPSNYERQQQMASAQAFASMLMSFMGYPQPPLFPSQFQSNWAQQPQQQQGNIQSQLATSTNTSISTTNVPSTSTDGRI